MQYLLPILAMSEAFTRPDPHNSLGLYEFTIHSMSVANCEPCVKFTEFT